MLHVYERNKMMMMMMMLAPIKHYLQAIKC